MPGPKAGKYCFREAVKLFFCANAGAAKLVQPQRTGPANRLPSYVGPLFVSVGLAYRWQRARTIGVVSAQFFVSIEIWCRNSALSVYRRTSPNMDAAHSLHASLALGA